MPADQPLGGQMHDLGIERARHAPGAILLKGEIGAAIDDAVKIMTFDGGEARVEVRRRALDRQHRHRLRP